MRKWMLYIVVASLLLACTGCGEGNGQTPTNVSSVVSQTPAQSKLEESAVSQGVQEESSLIEVKNTSSGEEKSPVQTNKKPQEEVLENHTKIEYTWKQQSKNNRVEITGNHQFSVSLCNTYQEFKTSLKANVSDTGYTKEYFETGNLVLITFSTATQHEWFDAYEFYVIDHTLYMGWVKRGAGMPPEEEQVWQYFLEVKGPIEDITTVHCKVHHGNFGYGGEQYVYDMNQKTLKTLVLEEEFIPANDTADGNFEIGKILVGIKKKYSVVNKVWTAADFPELKGITKIEDLTYADTPEAVEVYSQTEDFHQMLVIYISGKTKQDVINGIAALSKNEKLLFAEANNYMTID